MKTILRLVLFFSILSFFGSCVTSKQTNLMQDIPKDYPKGHYTEYKVIPGDKLTVNVFAIDEEVSDLFSNYQNYFTWQNYNDEATDYYVGKTKPGYWDTSVRPFTIYADGTINFPYLGKIYVSGFTLLEVRNILSEKLEEFAEGTSAEVSLSNSYFSILGEAGARRIDMPSPKITIYQALALSPSISPSGDRSKVKILRQTHEGTTINTIDLRSKDLIDSEFYYIQANDVIYYPQAKRKFLGAPSTFVSMFSLLTSIAGLITFAVRII